MVAAAGDGDEHSCGVSPASASGVISVAATHSISQLPLPNSNFGRCIHIHAPGHNLPSAWPDMVHRNYSHAVVRSGSSVAAAVVAGLAAVALGLANGALDSLNAHGSDSHSRSMSAPLLQALLRRPKDEAKDEPHRMPWDECQATSAASIQEVFRAIIREQVSKKLASSSLDGLKQQVAEKFGGESFSQRRNAYGESGGSDEATESKAQAFKDKAVDGKSGDPPPVLTEPPKKRKSQAEIIEEAKKIRKKKKSNAKQ